MPHYLFGTLRTYGTLIRVRSESEQCHRAAVGGLWHEIGQLQFDFLVGRGLRPHHYFQDIGCGSLRAGVKLIPYLESGHYYGIDKDSELLRCGRDFELTHDDLKKNPVLLQMENFDFETLGRRFDFAMAQSVFTHIPIKLISRCLLKVVDALKPGGILFATFFENSSGTPNSDPIEWHGTDGTEITTYPDRDPYHYSFATFEFICAATNLSVEYIGEWSHPRQQRMLSFARKP